MVLFCSGLKNVQGQVLGWTGGSLQCICRQQVKGIFWQVLEGCNRVKMEVTGFQGLNGTVIAQSADQVKYWSKFELY